MKNLPSYEQYIKEKMLYDPVEGKLVDSENKIQIKPTRYMIHISEPKNRYSIMSIGLIPKDADKSKWGHIAKEAGIPTIYKHSLFASTWKDSFDVYDAQNVNNYVFPLPILFEYVPNSKISIIDKFKDDIKDELIKISKDKKIKFKDKKIIVNDLLDSYSKKYYDLLRKYSEIDIWVIDTQGLKNKWYQDPFGGDSSDGEALWTDTRIPSENLILLKPNNQDILQNIDNFKDELEESRTEKIDGIVYTKRYPTDILIKVDIQKILDRHKIDSPTFYIDVENLNPLSRERIRKAKEFWMNYSTDQRYIDYRTGERKKELVTFEPSICGIYNGKLSFQDGRHRIIAMKELGYDEAVIEIPKNQKDLFKNLQ